MTHTAKKENVNMHNIVPNIKFQDESFYLQHWQMNKSSEVGGGRGKYWIEEARKKPTDWEGKCCACLGNEIKKKERKETQAKHPTTRQDRWAEKGVNPRPYFTPSPVLVYHWQRARSYFRRQVTDKRSLLLHVALLLPADSLATSALWA